MSSGRGNITRNEAVDDKSKDSMAEYSPLPNGRSREDTHGKKDGDYDNKSQGSGIERNSFTTGIC